MKHLSFLAGICKGDTDEIKIVDDCVLRKAKDLEIDEIENAIGKICEGFNRENPYFNEESKESNYWLLENSNEIIRFAFSLSSLGTTFFAISSVEDEISFTTRYNQIHIATYFHDKGVEEFNYDSEIDDEINIIIKNLKQLYELDDFKNKYDFLMKAINDFIELQMISKNSPFKILGLFSIIELLLTHKPDSSKSLDDSINRQIKTKVMLVNNRMEASVDYLEYFTDKSIGLMKLINKLYDYRSRIAHGSTIHLNLRLKDHDKNNIYKFLYELTRKLILQVIREPQLIKDLKAC